MKANKKICRKSLAQEFSKRPGPRYESVGPNSGEAFREKYLIPWIEHARAHNEFIVLNLDGVYGLPVSFTEEAFGGLQRHYNNFSVDVTEYLKWESQSDRLAIKDIQRYIDRARNSNKATR